MNYRQLMLEIFIIIILSLVISLPLIFSLIISLFTSNYFLIGFGGCVFGLISTYLILECIYSNGINKLILFIY